MRRHGRMILEAKRFWEKARAGVLLRRRHMNVLLEGGVSAYFQEETWAWAWARKCGFTILEADTGILFCDETWGCAFRRGNVQEEEIVMFLCMGGCFGLTIWHI
jgi:hypothetical protein